MIKYLLRSVSSIFLLSLLFISNGCKEKTLEERVIKLLQTEDSEDFREQLLEIADLLDPMAGQLLMAATKEYDRANEALKGLLELYSKEDFASTGINSRSRACIRKIVGYKSTDDQYTKEFKINLILNHIENNYAYREFWGGLLVDYCELGFERTYNLWQQSNVQSLVDVLPLFSNCSHNFIFENFGKKDGITDIMARMGSEMVPFLKSKFADDNRDIRFAAADALIKMKSFHPESTADLTDALGDNNIDVVAKNYPYYMRLGAPGSEGILVKALRLYFSEDMCLDYINCGNGIIESSAEQIARSKGYFITRGVGSHSGPKWGSESN
jgi:hypothetical protein